ncbi:MAG TPA: TorF family putative porin [Oxalicibacterium sp.]
MKKLILAVAVSAAFAANVAQAQEAAAPAPDNQFAFNAAFSSDYRFRGISQTHGDPAISGGVDYTHNPTGLYAGVWASSIKWVDDGGGDSDIEYDLYGGIRGEIVKDVSYDVGVLRYFYPGSNLGVNPDTTEVYGAVGYGPVSLKYSHAVTNAFGTDDSEDSNYIEANGNFEIVDGYMLNVHAGHQKIKGSSKLSYTDWKVGVTKDFSLVTVSLAVVGTDADDDAYFYQKPNGSTHNNGKTGAVLTLSKSF